MPSAPHSHFWPGRGVGGAAELDHVDGDRAGALRAVEDHRHADLGQRGGRDLARAPVHVRARDRGRAARPRRRARANGTARISAPRSRAAISGPISPGCSSSEVTISSPGPMSIPASTLPSPSLVEVVSAMSSTRGAEQLRVARAQLVLELEPALEVRAPPPLLDLRARAPAPPPPARPAAPGRPCRRSGTRCARGWGTARAARPRSRPRRIVSGLLAADGPGRAAGLRVEHARRGGPARPRRRRRDCRCRRRSARSPA